MCPRPVHYTLLKWYITFYLRSCIGNASIQRLIPSYLNQFKYHTLDAQRISYNPPPLLFFSWIANMWTFPIPWLQFPQSISLPRHTLNKWNTHINKSRMRFFMRYIVQNDYFLIDVIGFLVASNYSKYRMYLSCLFFFFSLVLLVFQYACPKL